LRKFSACASAWLSNFICVSLLTPSTSSATSAPKLSDIGLTGQAMLTFMGFCAEEIGAINILHLFLVQVGLQHLAQIADQET
jgi:hypothetical protein